jgi:hypothetical protein
MIANFFRIEGGNDIYEKAITFGYFRKVCAVMYKSAEYSTE